MPFSGISRQEQIVNGNLVKRLKRLFPSIAEQAQSLPTTARIFSLPGQRGTIGLIQGYSRLFCKTCNKVRITPTGMLKNCLYDSGVLDLKDLLRNDATDQEIQQAARHCVLNRHANGHEADSPASQRIEPSMATIGG